MVEELICPLCKDRSARWSPLWECYTCFRCGRVLRHYIRQLNKLELVEGSLKMKGTQ